MHGVLPVRIKYLFLFSSIFSMYEQVFVGEKRKLVFSLCTSMLDFHTNMTSQCAFCFVRVH